MYVVVSGMVGIRDRQFAENCTIGTPPGRIWGVVIDCRLFNCVFVLLPLAANAHRSCHALFEFAARNIFLRPLWLCQRLVASVLGV